MNKVQIYVKEYWHYIVMIAWTIIWYIAVCMGRTPFLSRPDTKGYQITSLSELSWCHRLPGYQIISLLFYNLGGGRIRKWR